MLRESKEDPFGLLEYLEDYIDENSWCLLIILLIIMSEFEGRNQPDKELNFSLTLDVSAFSQGIQDNFRIIWEAMQKQSA